MLAYIEHADADDQNGASQHAVSPARSAFDAAKRSVGAGALSLLPKTAVSFDSLNTAMDELECIKTTA